jgi:hypothetical protein
MPSYTFIEGFFLGGQALNQNTTQFLRVKLNTTSGWDIAGLTDFGSASLMEDGSAWSTTPDPDGYLLRLFGYGTYPGVASGAIAGPGLALYSAAGGKISTTQGTGAVLVGESLESAADGGVTPYIAFSQSAL